MARKQKTAAQKARAKATCEKRISEARQATTDEIVKLMERDGLDWHKDWNVDGVCNVFDPHNPITGTHYRGGNLVGLAMACIAYGIDDNRFCTDYQAKKRGWTIRPDAHRFTIEKWKQFSFVRTDADGNEVLDADGNPDYVSYYKPVSFFYVYNFSQIDGAPQLEKIERPKREREELDDLIDALEGSSRCRMLEDGGDRAYYQPGTDSIHVPHRDFFESLNGALRTYLHEMGHSTMHPTACDRQEGRGNRKGSEKYAYEELVAELTAVFSAAYLGLDLGDAGDAYRENHAAYLKSWLKKLKSDTSYIYRAAADASKACDYIIDRLTAAHPEYTRDADMIDDVDDATTAA